MSPVGFDPTIPAFEGENTVHALHLAAAMIGKSVIKIVQLYQILFVYPFYFIPKQFCKK
jgi:hypothetical protein